MLHKGKTLFLSSEGKKTILNLGIQDDDEVTVGGVDSGCSKRNQSGIRAKSQKGKKKPKRTTKSKSKRKKSQVCELTEEEITEKHRQAHSKALSRFFEELKPLLKEIRN